MVNTRILEQRLGWRKATTDAEPEPPAQAIAHEPMLQGRIEPVRRSMNAGPRRLAVDDAWAQLPLALNDLDQLGRRRNACPAIDRTAMAGAAMDQLRTQVMRVIKAEGYRRIGVTSASRGAGRSFVAAGLAASFARLDSLRVLLVDADLTAPGLGDLLGIAAPGPLEAVLTGQTPAEAHLQRVGANLALALNDTPLPDAADLMHAPDAILALRAMIDLLAPDVVIHDLPPLLGDSLTAALLPQMDAVLLVADGLRTTAQDILECERVLEGQRPLLGVILNKSEDRDPRPPARRRA